MIDYKVYKHIYTTSCEKIGNKDCLKEVLALFKYCKNIELRCWKDSQKALNIANTLNLSPYDKTNYMLYFRCESKIFFDNVDKMFLEKSDNEYIEDGLIFFDVILNNTIYFAHYGTEIIIFENGKNRAENILSILKKYDISFNVD